MNAVLCLTHVSNDSSEAVILNDLEAFIAYYYGTNVNESSFVALEEELSFRAKHCEALIAFWGPELAQSDEFSSIADVDIFEMLLTVGCCSPEGKSSNGSVTITV